VSCGQEGVVECLFEGNQVCGEDGVMAPRYPQGRCLKLFRVVDAGGPGGEVHAAKAVVKWAPVMSWWGRGMKTLKTCVIGSVSSTVFVVVGSSVRPFVHVCCVSVGYVPLPAGAKTTFG